MAYYIGAQKLTGDRSQRGALKVPSLRNVELTAPYRHSGRFATLREAAEFYNGGLGHAIPEGEEVLIHWHIREPQLTNDELDRLVDFMKTLTDQSVKPAEPEALPCGMQTAHNKVVSASYKKPKEHNNE